MLNKIITHIFLRKLSRDLVSIYVKLLYEIKLFFIWFTLVHFSRLGHVTA